MFPIIQFYKKESAPHQDQAFVRRTLEYENMKCLLAFELLTGGELDALDKRHRKCRCFYS